MNCKTLIPILFFLIIYSANLYGQNHGDYSEINIDVNVNVNSGEIEINPLEIQNLKVLIYGAVRINIYGAYDSAQLEKLPTERSITLSISPNFIDTTLEPIIIPPPTRSQLTKTDKIFLGFFDLNLLNNNYNVTTGDHIFTLRVEENSYKTIIDKVQIPIDIYNDQDLADLEVTNAKILRSGLRNTREGVTIKSYIENTGEKDVVKKSKVNFYSKKEDDFQLLGSIILEPLEENGRKSVTLPIKSSTYRNIVNDYIYIVADADDDIFERDSYNNTLRYYVPELQSSDTTIKAYPNPFKDKVNFTFFLSENAHPLIILNIYDDKGNFRGEQGYLEFQDNSIITISYSNSTLPAGRYIYGILVNNIQYYGTIIKK
ncbi:CARDB domain-containing protein [uncultured Aquimarina sp.]|uniref:CARDB domain-containing protein n=1 Tax=uncultured Aquimarina sp. TaxID=575652 RepID=UPI002603812A|nr:CARDB domain-containing protein [uncultured Aquimarina sp.]